MVSAAAAGKAILENPEKFANAFKTTLEATGDFSEKAIKVAESARHLIATTTTEHAVIINISDKSLTWFIYNDAAPVKWTT